MKKWLTYLLIIIVSILTGWELNSLYNSPRTSPNPVNQVKRRPLDKYTIDNLSKLNGGDGYSAQMSDVKIDKTLKEDVSFTSYLISFTDGGKKVTGLMNIPKGVGPFPVVVMFRGYVDQKQYKTGDGTRKAMEFFAKNGFITVAPDFLGYGGSDKESDDVFESRFQTYTTALTLLSSLQSIKEWDGKNVFIWGHSNGGQIALTILEITKKQYPTVLWAPLSKPFPYSILVYSDEASDSGKFLRTRLASFEDTYDTDLYSLTNYLDRISAPLQIHQGTADDAVRVDWTDSFVKKLKKLGLAVNYFKYPGADHNLTPGWDMAVSRDITFFKKNTQSLTR